MLTSFSLISSVTVEWREISLKGEEKGCEKMFASGRINQAVLVE